MKKCLLSVMLFAFVFIIGVKDVFADLCSSGVQLEINGKYLCMNVELDEKNLINDRITIYHDFSVEVYGNSIYIDIYELIDKKIDKTNEFNPENYKLKIDCFNAYAMDEDGDGSGWIELESNLKGYGEKYILSKDNSDYDFWKDYEFYVNTPAYIFPDYDGKSDLEEEKVVCEECDLEEEKVVCEECPKIKDYTLKFMDKEYNLPMNIIIPSVIGLIVLFIIIMIVQKSKNNKLTKKIIQPNDN